LHDDPAPLTRKICVEFAASSQGCTSLEAAVVAIFPVPNDDDNDTVAKREELEAVGAAALAAACLAPITLNIASPPSSDDLTPK
jgi:hypothetical protein